MATYTTNYNLIKPDTSDLVKVSDLNGNADIIDSALAGKEDSLPNGTADGDVLTWDDVNDEWTAQAPAAGGGFVAQDTAPLDTDLLWVDTSDNTISGGGGSVPSGTKYGDMLMWDNNEWTVKRVFQMLSYIESTGNQYIDTGYVPTTNTKVVADVTNSLVATGGNMYAVFGSYASVGATQDSSKYRVGGMSAGTGVATSLNSRTTLTCGYNGNGLRYITDGVNTYTGTAGYSPTVSILISADRDSSNNVVYKGRYKFHSVQIYENDVLVRDYRPCYNCLIGTTGMLDILNFVFYPNAGTGAFNKGAEI